MSKQNDLNNQHYRGWMEQVDSLNIREEDKRRKNEYGSGNRSPKKIGHARTSPKRTSPKRRYSPERKVSSNTKDHNSFFKNTKVTQNQSWGNRGKNHGNVFGQRVPRSHAPRTKNDWNEVSRSRNDREHSRNRGDWSDSGRRNETRNKHRNRKFGMKQLNTKPSFKSKSRGKPQRSRSWGEEQNQKYHQRSRSWGTDLSNKPSTKNVRERHSSDPRYNKQRKKHSYNSKSLPSNYVSEIHPRQRFKHFSQEVKTKKDFTEAENYANKILENSNYIPPHQRWKVFVTIAEMARRESRFQEARKWFRKAGKEHPSEPQIWLEYARMEEECGLMGKAEQVLLEGLIGCPYSESLYIKLIRQYEQLNQIDKSRKLLGKVLTSLGDSLLRVWRVILEGALMESRMGRIEEARIAFQFLMEKCPNNGSIYLEALRLEQKREDDETSLRIIRIGLKNARTHAPLWSHAMKLFQKRGEMEEMRRMVRESVRHVTKEIRWKMYYMGAELEADSLCLKNARFMYKMAIECCPVPLRWKIWLAGTRREIQAGKEDVAIKLLKRAEMVVPQKYRYIVLLEYAKMEEYCGRLDHARKWTQIAKKESPHEWKVFLESVLLEMRHGEYERAREEAREGLALHGGTGRLWAMHIRLQYHLGEDEQFKLFQRALKIVPKSGEVWCEGARIRLNPLSNLFSVQMAKKYLSFAIKFTPQFGDNFIEYLRAELLTVGPRIDEEEEIKHLERLCVNAEPNYGPLWFFCRKSPSESSIKVIRRSKSLLITELMKYQRIYQQAILSQNVELKTKKKSIQELKEDHEYKEFMTGLRSFCNYSSDTNSLNSHQKNVLRQSIFSDTFNI